MIKYSLENIDKILSALSERNRLRIVAILDFRPLAVCEIREILGLSFSTVSRHLAILKEAGLIAFTKDGKWVHYHLDSQLDSEIQTLVRNLLVLISDDKQVKDDLEKAKSVDKNLICKIPALANKDN
ncbi:MAG: ArsR/SmtB family transcription factor, partial [Candidatus Saccharicenans sp.]